MLSRSMRTALTLDDDVLAAARGLAERQNKSIGEVISALVREALLSKNAPGAQRNGIPLLPRPLNAEPVASGLINQLRDELA